MDKYKIGGMIFEVSSPNKSHISICRDYICQNDDCPTDFIITVTEQDIENEKKLYSYPCTSSMANSSFIYRCICHEAIKRGGFFLHSAVVEYKNKAYAFLAPSGTGKSTHIKLWRKLLKNEVSIVNGDKPLIMPCPEGGFLAYGTPWSGKEGWARNVWVKTAAICVLNRGKNNSIKEISPISAMAAIMKQTLIPSHPDEAGALLENVDRFISSGIRCFYLECNMDIEAAITSFEKMTGDKAPNTNAF